MKTAIFLVSGPSGSGKTTLVQQACIRLPQLWWVHTYTTRAPRAGERSGIDYHFVSVERFQALEQASFFLETNYYNGNWYGTPRELLDHAEQSQPSVIITDINGTASLLSQFTHAITLWITAPRIELARRLLGRGSESPAQQQERLQRACEEEVRAQESNLFRYSIENIDLGVATNKLCMLIEPHL